MASQDLSVLIPLRLLQIQWSRTSIKITLRPPVAACSARTREQEIKGIYSSSMLKNIHSRLNPGTRARNFLWSVSLGNADCGVGTAG